MELPHDAAVVDTCHWAFVQTQGPRGTLWALGDDGKSLEVHQL